MATIRQITDILSRQPRFEICNEAYRSFDLIDWKDKQIYNIKVDSTEEMEKLAMYNDAEWEANLPNIERKIIA